MKSLIKVLCVCGLILVASGAAQAQYGSICNNPAQKQCVGQYDDFKLYDLVFNTGRAELGTGTRHESDEFYAVILESVKAEKQNGGCNFVSETKRRAAQKLFPNNKIFASREYCRGTVVRYDSVNKEYNFMAVYGVETEAEAAIILTKARKKYSLANIRKSRVVLDFSDE